MLWLSVAGYCAFGLVASGFMLAVFPPSPGYKPPNWVLASAVLTYVATWPLIVFMGLGYVFGCGCRNLTPEGQTFVQAARSQVRYRTLYDEAQCRN